MSKPGCDLDRLSKRALDSVDTVTPVINKPLVQLQMAKLSGIV